MIRRLRSGHRAVFVALAVALPVGLVWSTAGRVETPLETARARFVDEHFQSHGAFEVHRVAGLVIDVQGELVDMASEFDDESRIALFHGTGPVWRWPDVRVRLDPDSYPDGFEGVTLAISRGGTTDDLAPTAYERLIPGDSPLSFRVDDVERERPWTFSVQDPRGEPRRVRVARSANDDFHLDVAEVD
ncbi:MAG: hypothetical protein R3F34_19425 [Planctomycetota bacterium]